MGDGSAPRGIGSALRATLWLYLSCSSTGSARPSTGTAQATKCYLEALGKRVAAFTCGCHLVSTWSTPTSLFAIGTSIFHSPIRNWHVNFSLPYSELAHQFFTPLFAIEVWVWGGHYGSATAAQPRAAGGLRAVRRRRSAKRARAAEPGHGRPREALPHRAVPLPVLGLGVAPQRRSRHPDADPAAGIAPLGGPQT